MGLIKRECNHSFGRTVEGVTAKDGELFTTPIGEFDGISTDRAAESTVVLGIVGGKVQCKVFGKCASRESSEGQE